MPDQRLRWLRADLRRTVERIRADQQHLREIEEEIALLERETSTPRKRHLRSVGGAGIVGVGAAAAEWIRENPAATAMVALATLGGLLGLVSSQPWGPPPGAPVAVPARPAPAVPPQTTPAELPSTREAIGAPTTPTTRAPTPRVIAVPVTGRPPVANPPVPIPTREPTTRPQAPPPPVLPPPPNVDPHGCDGIHLVLRPLAEACVLG